MFVFGALDFFVISFVFLVAWTGLVAIEKNIHSVVLLTMYLLFLQFFSNVDLIHLVRYNPLVVAGWILLYFWIGTAWALFKWFCFCKQNVEKYKEAKKKFCDIYKVDPDNLSEDLRSKWRAQGRSYSLKVKDHKKKIIQWMAFWIPGVIWALLHDLVKNIFSNIYNSIAWYLQKIADSIGKEIKDDLSDI